MDWTTPLKVQQADFQQRLRFASDTSDLSLLLRSARPGLHGEVVEIMGDRLSQLRAQCRRFILRSDPSIPVRDLLRRYLKEQLARTAVATVLDATVVPIEFDPAAETPEPAFHSAERPQVCIAVEVTVGDRMPTLSASPHLPECDLIVWVWIREPIDETCPSYRPVLAGFLPIDRMPATPSIEWDELFYIGGLRAYLESFRVSAPTVSSKWLRPVTGSSNFAYPLAVSADGTRVVSGSYDGKLKVWQLSESELSGLLAGHPWSFAPTPTGTSGQSLSMRSTDKTLQLLQSGNAKLARTLDGHPSGITAVALSPNGVDLVSGGCDGTVKIWDLTRSELRYELKVHRSAVRAIAVSADGRSFASGGLDRSIEVRSTDSGEVVLALASSGDSIAAVALSSDGTVLACGSQSGNIEVWNVPRGEKLYDFEGHAGTVRSMVIGEDGRLLASGSTERTLKLWDIQTGQLQQVLTGYTDPLVAVAPNAKGTWLELSLFQQRSDDWQLEP
ncbi:MAG: WD40 repeat domain-containing protein [Cyanobacteria bacterium SBC]|nr:WD40 repeat domain-containing protein [Cyanobacteria bacterium SBC]